MILIIDSPKDLKPGFDGVAIENLSLSSLTTEAYRVALSDRARVVLLIREGDPRIRILKDLTDRNKDDLRESYVAPTLAIMTHREPLPFPVAGRFETIRPVEDIAQQYPQNVQVNFRPLPADFEPLHDPATLRCCADLCEQCAAGNVPTPTDRLVAGKTVIVHSGGAERWHPCAAAPIWRRLYGAVSTLRVDPD